VAVPAVIIIIIIIVEAAVKRKNSSQILCPIQTECILNSRESGETLGSDSSIERRSLLRKQEKEKIKDISPVSPPPVPQKCICPYAPNNQAITKFCNLPPVPHAPTTLISEGKRLKEKRKEKGSDRRRCISPRISNLPIAVTGCLIAFYTFFFSEIGLRSFCFTICLPRK